MTHEELMNLMLANICPKDRIDGYGNIFILDLHWAELEIHAKMLTLVPTITYEILWHELRVEP